MNFTRDPIIETVITPREGCKLVVRSSKGANQEDYLVDALEVVSFGHSFFFRSLERPKSFLVPVSDYEIFESKETRMVLKNASAERSIKISGGREPSRREGEPEEGNFDRSSGPAVERPGERKGRDNKRRRGRRGRDRHEPYPAHEETETAPREQAPEEEFAEEAAPAHATQEAPKEKPVSFISKLFPPPPTLIKDTIGRYKQTDSAPEDLFPMKSTESLEDNALFDGPSDLSEPPMDADSSSEEE